MSPLLTLSRAARLVGVSRGALQKKVKDGELPTFEGMVAPSELLRVYPQAHLEDNTLFEKLNQIKENAFARRIREHILPDPEVLIARLSDLGRELAGMRAQVSRYRDVLAEFDRRLAALAEQWPDGARQQAGQIRDWLQSAVNPETDETGQQLLAAMERTMRIMVAQVTLLPSQREFFVEGSDNLLDAALRAGLALNYGCSNGNCGLCKARVVSGQVKRVRNHDYVLSESEKRQGMVLMCCHTAVSDLVIEAEEAGGVKAIPLQQIAARVKKIEPLADDLILLHVQTPRTRRLRFLAGQTVSLRAANSPASDYPVASCPCDDRNLQFHVPRQPGNAFSDLVFHGLKSGDTLEIDGPRGEFVLREDSPRTGVFIAWDTGFAPIKSLIEHAMALDAADALHLYWFAPPGHGHYMKNLCRAWSDALDNFHFTALDMPASAGADPSALRAGLAHVLDDHRQLRDCDVYVSGSATLLETAREQLLAQGLPLEQLMLDRPN